MKPNFALDLANDTITLLRRGAEGWIYVGQTPFAQEDLPSALLALCQEAQALAPQGVTSKLVIPNSQILYTEVDAKGPSDQDRLEQIASALEKITPYKRDEMVFDWTKNGDQILVAAVALETLEEAETFAKEAGFNPISLVALPERGFRFEPWFGRTRFADSFLGKDEIVERDYDLLEIEEPNAALSADHEATPQPSDTQSPARKPKAPLWVEVDAPAPLTGFNEEAAAPYQPARQDEARQDETSPEPAVQAPAAEAPVFEGDHAAEEPAYEAKPEVAPAVQTRAPASSRYADEEDEPVVIPPSDAFPSLQSMFDDPDQFGQDANAAGSLKSFFDDIRAEDLSPNDLSPDVLSPEDDFHPSEPSDYPAAAEPIWPPQVPEQTAQADHIQPLEAAPFTAAAPLAAAARAEDIFAALPPRGTPFPLDVKPSLSQSAPQPTELPSQPEPYQAPPLAAQKAEDDAQAEAPFAHVQDPILEERAAQQEALIASDDAFGPESYGKAIPAYDPAEELAPADFFIKANAEAAAAAAAAAAGERRIKIDRASRSGGPQSASKLLNEQLDYEQPPQTPSSLLLRALAARRDAAPPAQIAPPPQRLRPLVPERPADSLRDPLPDVLSTSHSLYSQQSLASQNAQKPIVSTLKPQSAPPVPQFTPAPEVEGHKLLKAPPLAAQEMPIEAKAPLSPAVDLPPLVEQPSGFTPAPPLAAHPVTSASFAAPPALQESEPRRQPSLGTPPNLGASLTAGPALGKVPPRMFGKNTLKPAPKGAAKSAVAPLQPALAAETLEAASLKTAQARTMRGKPKYLGLILTAILLLAMAVVAAWATLSSDSGTSDPVSAPVSLNNGGTPLPPPAGEGESALPLGPSGQDQGLLSTTPDTQSAQAPQADQILVAAPETPPPALEAGHLAQPNAGAEPPPATPMAPPPFGTVYSFDDQGLLVPQAQGIQSPDGYTLFAGKPKLLPQPRPQGLTPAPLPEAQASQQAAEANPTPLVADSQSGTALIEGLPSPTDNNAANSNADQPNPELSRFKPRARPESLSVPAPPGDGAALENLDPTPATPADTPEVQLASFTGPTAEPTTSPSDPPSAGVAPSLRPLARPQTLAATNPAAAASLMANLPPDAAPATVQDVPAIDGGLAISLRPAQRPRNFTPPSSAVTLASAAAPSAPAVDAAIAQAMAQPPARNTPVPEPVPERTPTKQRNPLEDDENYEPEIKGTKATAATKAGVAKQATESRAINLSQLNVIGIYGSQSNRYAMVRTKNGKFNKVKVGDKLDGGRVQAITQTEVRYQKGNKIHALAIPSS